MKYVGKRFITLIITLLCISAVTFAAFSVIPGNASLTRLGTDATPEQVADFFRVLGDGTRVRILMLLSAGEMRVGTLAEGVGMSLSAVSHQLRILRGASLIAARREGKGVFYRLADDHVHTILDMTLEHLEE